MKTNKKKIHNISLVIVIALMMTLLVFAGCGQNTRLSRHPNSDPTIETQLEIQIRQSYVDNINAYHIGHPNYEWLGSPLTIYDIYIFRYYGTYNGTSVLSIRVYGDGWNQAILVETVAGIDFWQSGINIRVWRDNEFSSLTQAYYDDLLNIVDLQTIYQIHEEMIPHGLGGQLWQTQRK